MVSKTQSVPGLVISDISGYMAGVHVARDSYWQLITDHCSSAPATPEHIDPDGSDQDRALDYILREIRDILERHAVIQTRYKKRAKTPVLTHEFSAPLNRNISAVTLLQLQTKGRNAHCYSKSHYSQRYTLSPWWMNPNRSNYALIFRHYYLLFK